ncbi:MAG: hypothetical protein ABW000_11890 [Actinoplanes sp.]
MGTRAVRDRLVDRAGRRPPITWLDELVERAGHATGTLRAVSSRR